MKNLERIQKDSERDEFYLSAWVADNLQAVHLALSKSETIRAIRDGLQTGTIDKEEVYEFVGSLLRDLRVGERFQHDLDIAAICVALENFYAHFVDEFINDLAEVELHEMRKSSGVARISQAKRARSVSDTVRYVCLHSSNEMDQESARVFVDLDGSRGLHQPHKNRLEFTAEIRQDVPPIRKVA